jgi:acyl transferase domain-containing protein
MLNPEGDGFAMSEAVVAACIQRRRDASRVYATIRHIKSNSDGYKKTGFMHPLGESQEKLLREMYGEIKIDPGQVIYVEAHGTG